MVGLGQRLWARRASRDLGSFSLVALQVPSVVFLSTRSKLEQHHSIRIPVREREAGEEVHSEFISFREIALQFLWKCGHMATLGCKGAWELLLLPPWPWALLKLDNWGSIIKRKKRRVDLGNSSLNTPGLKGTRQECGWLGWGKTMTTGKRQLLTEVGFR